MITYENPLFNVPDYPICGDIDLVSKTSYLVLYYRFTFLVYQ